MIDPTLSILVEGYTLAASARRLSPHTLSDYLTTYRKFINFAGDLPLSAVTKHHIETFLASQTVSKKTLLNYHTGLSALWTWAVDEGLTPTHLLRQIKRPRPEKTAVIPFSDADLAALFASLAKSRPYLNHGAAAANTLANLDRNRAILFTLLDTGLRADELCSLTLADFDHRNLRLHVDDGKGNKERYVPISSRTAQSIWKYLAGRPAALATDPLYLSETGATLNRNSLLKQLKAIGRRAGVKCHPHRFRHTFAVSYLRNGGDPYTLQQILGHATLDMVKTYLRLSQTDLAAAHKRASPVANLKF